MKKNIKKFYQKIKNNIKHLNKIINYSNKESNINKIILFFDIIYSILIYGISLDEYKYYEFYYVESQLRKTYLTNRKHNKILKRITNYKDINLINNKDRFYRKFNSYIKRDVINTKQLSYKQFEELLLCNKRILSRSVSKSFISSFKIFNLNNYRGPGFILEEINNNNLFLVEKMFNQHELLNNINNELVIINIVTLNIKNNIKVISSSISFKENNKLVHGMINTKTGNTYGHFIYEDTKLYSKNITEYVIPNYKEMISFVKNISKELNEFGEIKWSLCINSNNEIYLMDASIWEDYYLYQRREYLNNKVGLITKYNSK